MTEHASTRVRCYHTLRTAHLERALELDSADIIYGQRRYDFDSILAEAVSDRSRLEQAGGLRLSWLLARRGYDAIEINEPIALETIRRTAWALAATSLSDFLRRHRTLVVTYAIGNVPISSLPRPLGKARLGRLLDERLAPFVWRRCDRVAFGTQAAQAAYHQSFGPASAHTQRTMIPALPTVCSCAPNLMPRLSERGVERLLFLGDLSVRKGFDLVVDAWAEVRDRRPRAELVIVGRGNMIEMAKSLAAKDDRVSFIEDPPRAVVHEHLRRAGVVALPSQPTRAWREQVGLPLVEALAHGCTVVTTEETGIADWLSAHGHRTMEAEEACALLPTHLVEALTHPLDPASVLASLPARDGRLEADTWMFSANATLTS